MDPLMMTRNLRDMITTKLQHSTYLVSYIWLATMENKWGGKKKIDQLVKWLNFELFSELVNILSTTNQIT